MSDDENPRRRKRRTCEEYPGHCGQWPEDCVCYERLRTKAQALVDTMPKCFHRQYRDGTRTSEPCGGHAVTEIVDGCCGATMQICAEHSDNDRCEELPYARALLELLEELGL